MRQAWLSEVLLLGLLTLVAGVLGMLTGEIGWWLFLALSTFIGRHLYQLYRLERWLRVGRLRNPPQSWGIWGEVFEHYYRLQRRYYKRKKRLGKVIREFRESTAAMPDGTMVLDGELRIMWFNAAARELLRLSTSRDLGQSVLNLIRAPSFKQYLVVGKYEQSVTITSPADDTRNLALRLIPYGSDQYLLLFRDVTRMTRLQAMRRDFVANASHELRSPLTVLAGYLETMADEHVLGPEWDMPINEMRAQCQRMNSLVDDLLELSRLETEESDAPTDTLVDVCSLVDRIIQYARSEDVGRHEFVFDCAAEGQLAGIERELYSAFSNLVINAMRYTDDDGKISARWYRRPDGEWAFEVTDNGIGIAAKHIPLITQRFYRVDSSHSRKKGGTGLGLAIVKHVLQRHNGRLEVDSVPDEGSTFRCVFPATRVREAAALTADR